MSSVCVVAGCETMPHHTNTLFFGTATTLGVEIGAATPGSPTPQGTVGYSRVEALALPLLANVSFKEGGTNDEKITACDPRITATGTLGGTMGGDIDVTVKKTTNGQPQGIIKGKVATTIEVKGADAESGVKSGHECKFIGTRGEDEDTYSVLATFRGKVAGSGNAGSGNAGSGNENGNEVKANVAQYFASGHAAVILAERAGAAAVSTGKAAEESARTSVELSTLRAYINSPEVVKMATELKLKIEKAYNDLRDAVTADDGKQASQRETLVLCKMKEVDATVYAGVNRTAALCPDARTCLVKIGGDKAKLSSEMLQILDVYTSKDTIDKCPVVP